MKVIRGIHLPDTDTHFEYHLMQGPMFEGAGTYQFKKVKKALDVVESYNRFGTAIDVGAHVGLWTRVLGYHFRRTFAFEPVPKFLECLDENIKDCPNFIYVYPNAVASKSRMVAMNAVMDNTGNTHVRPVNKGGIINEDHPLVKALTLDSIDINEKVDFLKIDVEGYELEVLKGATRILTEDLPIIVVEQKPGNAERYGLKQHDALRYLEDLGYERVWEMSGDYCVTHKKRPT